jgi:predicted transcriptional regulator
MRKRNLLIQGVSLTSKMSYRELLATVKNIREAEYVYSLFKIASKPLTSREISIISIIERTCITRILYNLIEDKLIKAEKFGKCQIKQRTVKYYTING